MTNEEAIKELKIVREDYWDEYGDPMPALDMAIKALEQQAEVIRCKDCNHEFYCCRLYNRTPDSYCSYAERRTDG